MQCISHALNCNTITLRCKFFRYDFDESAISCRKSPFSAIKNLLQSITLQQFNEKFQIIYGTIHPSNDIWYSQMLQSSNRKLKHKRYWSNIEIIIWYWSVNCRPIVSTNEKCFLGTTKFLQLQFHIIYFNLRLVFGQLV